MPLNNAAADAVAALIADDFTNPASPNYVDPATASSAAYWRNAVRRIFAGIAANAVVNTTISGGAVATGVTAGGASVPVTGATAGTVS